MQYLELVKVYQQLESTTKLLEKTEILADFLAKIDSRQLKDVILLVQGKVFPEYDSRELGLGTQLAIKAISSAGGMSAKKVVDKWKSLGDLGETAKAVIGNKKQATLFSSQLTVSKVLQNLQKLAELEGAGTVDRKVSLLKELLSSAQADASKYIIRTCLGDLRVGIGGGVMRDSISQAFGVSKEAVQNAYDLTADFGEVASSAKQGGEKALAKSEIKIGNPIKIMLFQKAESIADAFERVGKPAAFEYKYDGFRLQIHCSNGRVKLFTRRQEDVTKQFPDIVQVAKKQIKADNYLLDSEIIGLDAKTGRWLPFQDISQRIRRKYHIEEICRRIPVIVNVFDAVCIDNKTLLDIPFRERRTAIEKIVKLAKNKIGLARQIVTSSEKQAEKFYEEALKKGNEGLMAKNLDSEYKPGSRVGYGVKIKPVMETLDLAIVGAEWGTGKRGGWLSSFILACRDEKGGFLEIGKMGTGIKEKQEMGVSFQELTRMIKPLIVSESGKSVTIKPKIVAEVAYEEIQKSPTYSSGFALRFPRLARLRVDLKADDADDISRVKSLFAGQRGK